MKTDKLSRFWDDTRSRVTGLFLKVTTFCMDNDPLKVTVRLVSAAYEKVNDWRRPKPTIDPELVAFMRHIETILRKQPIDGAGWAHYIRKRQKPRP